MSIADVRKWRKMPFLKRGMTVFYVKRGSWGKITSTHGHNLMIKLDYYGFTSNFHPWFELAYYDKEGLLIKDYSKSKSAPKSKGSRDGVGELSRIQLSKIKGMEK